MAGHVALKTEQQCRQERITRVREPMPKHEAEDQRQHDLRQQHGQRESDQTME